MSTPPEGDQLLTTKEVAALVKVAPATVSGWLWKRKLPREKAGGRTLIRRSALEAFMKESEKGSPSSRAA